MKIIIDNKSDYLQHQRFHFDFLGNFKDFEQWQAAIDQYDCWIKRDKNADYIPKIIHQIWIGENLPSRYADFQKSWRIKMPEYKYKMWNEDSILKLSSPLISFSRERRILEQKAISQDTSYLKQKVESM